nr:uncharacterized protein LOC102395067 isoform X6 [Bubalus bubalis]
MKIHLFFFILLFGVTILPARKRFPHYGSVDMRRECAKEVQMTEEKKETHVPRRRDQCYCLPSQPFCTSFQACVSLSCAKN